MRTEFREEIWLHEDAALTLGELAELAGWPEDELRLWVEEGWLLPSDPVVEPPRFGANRLVELRIARRLQRDFELEPLGLGLVLQLRDRIETLERALRALQARTPGAFG